MAKIIFLYTVILALVVFLNFPHNDTTYIYQYKLTDRATVQCSAVQLPNWEWEWVTRLHPVCWLLTQSWDHTAALPRQLLWEWIQVSDKTDWVLGP